VSDRSYPSAFGQLILTKTPLDMPSNNNEN